MHPYGVWSLVPPIIVLALGYSTRQVYIPLLAGIFSGAYIAAHGALISGLLLGTERIVEQFELAHLFGDRPLLDGWNILIGIFFIQLGTILKLIHASGGAKAYHRWVEKRLSSPRMIECGSLLLSLCLFIDDYFSALTVGSVMSMLTDKYRIARAKLAFLVDALASPLAMICPVSSWVAAVVGFLKEGGVELHGGENIVIHGSPYIAYLSILPYVSYSWLIFFGVWFIVLRKISYGCMAKRERVCQATGDVHGGLINHKTRSQITSSSPITVDSRIADFIAPIVILTVSIFLGIIYSGYVAGTPFNMVEAMRNASAAKGLVYGGTSALIWIVSFILVRGRLTPHQIGRCTIEGLQLMAPSILVLILAWSFGAVVRDDLQTGSYIAQSCAQNIPHMVIPFVFFLVSFVIAFSLGTSWGAAAILFPIGIQMIVNLPEYQSTELTLEMILPMLAPSLAAVLSGAVAGDHVSPISDTTIMSSTSTAMDHHDHVRTQVDYAWPVISTCALSYLLYGFFYESKLSMPWLLSLCICWSLLAVIYTWMHRREQLTPPNSSD
ncbi:MAG: hypothetical protein OXT67_01925 [Zetaproteobacteria bacterium]|nr:hypothetical protein [Zetaproteobacteria bacterium]